MTDRPAVYKWGNLFIHYLRVKDQHSPPVKRVGIYSQERQGDVAVDLGLDGDLDLEVEVKTELQGFLGGRDGLAVATTDDLSAEDRGPLGGCESGSGFWGRHCNAEEVEWRGCGFYNRARLVLPFSGRRE